MEEVLEQEAMLNVGVAADSLSEDVWLAVLKHVDWQTLASASQTCKLLHDVTASDSLWQVQWQAQFAKSHSYRMSSNDMGGCALKLRADPLQEAARAFQLLGATEPRRLPSVSDTYTLPPLSSSPDRPSTVGWKELFRKSREVDRGWQTGLSTSEPLEGHNDFIRCMQLSGETLVSCSGSVSHQDCSIRVWDLVTNTCKQVLRGHMGPIWCMAYEPSLNRIASGAGARNEPEADDYSVRYWDSVSGNSVFLEDPDSAVRCIHMDATARQLVAGTEFGQLLLWDMDALEEVLSAGVHNVVQHFERLDEARGNPRPLVVTGPGAGAAAARRAVTLLDGRHVEVDGSNHVRVADALDEGKAISAIQVQGGLCASTSIEAPSRIQLWDVSGHSWQLASTIGDAEMLYANSMSLEKDLNRMVAGCGDRNVRVWDLSTGTRLQLLSGHTEDIHAHQFDERTVAACSMGGQIRVWDMRTGNCEHLLQHGSSVHTFQYDGDRLVSGTWDGRVCLWDLRQGQLVKEWSSHYGRVWSVALDGYRIASAGSDSLINVRSFVPQQQQDHSAVSSPEPCMLSTHCGLGMGMRFGMNMIGPSDGSRTPSVMMDVGSSAEVDDEDVESSRSTMLSSSSREASAS